ncbi:hypothetical protein KI688_002174 [Linnemannia hyalina]|uniref:Transmembrane protein n=1 Tax=Linnemannia hyalina TaxID=64524 RepID=A0A9P8BUE5_9FUNG|nr:hypothetical protein KI688_002174 [Linnemannia hyalina]
MEPSEIPPASTTTDPSIPSPNPASETFDFTEFPPWTVPTRTGSLYPGRPGRKTTQDLPESTNNPGPGEPTANPIATDNGGGGIVVPTLQPGIIAPIGNTTTTSTALLGGTTTIAAAGEPLRGITLQPGSPTPFRGVITPTASSASSSGSYTLVPSSVTGLLFGFAIAGALFIGFVAGAIFMKYTRFGGGRRRKEQRREKGELTEQLRLLTDTLGHRNDRLDHEEKHIEATANQADFLPSWYHGRHLTGMYPGPWADRLHPQSVMDQSAYRDWVGGPYTPVAAVSSPVTPSSPIASLRHHPTNRQPRVINLPPSQSQSPTAENSDTYGPKGEWSTAGTSTVSSSNGSTLDLYEIEKRRPQIQEEGVGEDSLFNIDQPSHNPHVYSQGDSGVHSPIRSDWSTSSSNDSSSGNSSSSGGGGERSTPSSSNGSSAPDLHVFEVEKRRPQIQEEGVGEDSLFDVDHPSHNPHVTGRII